MKWKPVVISLVSFCLFISFQKSQQNYGQLHALITQRIKEAGTRNYKLLEQTLKEVEPQFDTPTDTLANLYHRLGAAYFNNDLELKAVPIYEKALNIRRKLLKINDFELSKSLQGYARTLARVRRLEEALPLLEENIKIREAILTNQSDSLAEAYMIYGGACTENGNYPKAIDYIQKAISIFEKNKRDSSRWGYAFQYLGNAYYFMKDFRKAEKSYVDAIDLLQKIGDIKGVSECNHNIGDVLILEKKYAQALPYLEKAQKDYPHSEYLSNLALTYAKLKQFDKARKFIEEASDFAIAHKNLCYYYLPRISITEGDIWMEQNNLDAALMAYNDAIRTYLSTDGLFAKETYLNPINLNEQAASCRPDLLKILQKTYTPLSMLYLKTHDTTYLKLQLHHLQVAETLIQDMLHNFSEENSRFFWTENVKDIYEKGITTALALGENEAALTFAESSKAFNLLSEVQNNKAKRFGGVPDALLEKERELKSTTAFWQKVNADPAIDSTRMAQAREGLLTAKQDFDAFQKRLEKDYPRYFDLKYQKAKPLSISDIQKTLNEEKVLVEYFLTDTILYTFVVSKTDYKVYKTLINNIFYQNIADLRKATGDYNFIKNKPDSAQILYLKTARSLYKTLLEYPLSILGKKTRLTIIPDGALAYIPFDLLLTDSTTSWRDAETPFLLKKLAISYAYSLKLLNLEENNTPLMPSASSRQGVTVSGDFGGFGISYDAQKFFFSEKEKQNEKITPLKYTIEEVKNIKSKLGGKAWLDETATKQNFNENAPKCDLLHLAMHGFLDPNDPLNTGLIFSRTQVGDSTNYLTGYDLYATQLKAKLAVLSACNTGDGQLRGREGVMSLARSFAFAGCESLIMSLWSVPDKTTSEIMIAFYDNLKKGMSKDVALQQAKIMHLENAEPSRRIPNNWAAMVVIGNVEPLSWKAWWQSWWVILGVITILILGLFFKNKYL